MGLGEGFGQERGNGVVGVGSVPDGLEGIGEEVSQEGGAPRVVVNFEELVTAHDGLWGRLDEGYVELSRLIVYF